MCRTGRCPSRPSRFSLRAPFRRSASADWPACRSRPARLHQCAPACTNLPAQRSLPVPTSARRLCCIMRVVPGAAQAVLVPHKDLTDAPSPGILRPHHKHNCPQQPTTTRPRQACTQTLSCRAAFRPRHSFNRQTSRPTDQPALRCAGLLDSLATQHNLLLLEPARILRSASSFVTQQHQPHTRCCNVALSSPAGRCPAWRLDCPRRRLGSQMLPHPEVSRVSSLLLS